MKPLLHYCLQQTLTTVLLLFTPSQLTFLVIFIVFIIIAARATAAAETQIPRKESITRQVLGSHPAEDTHKHPGDGSKQIQHLQTDRRI
jgi:hypothetical protein